MTDRESLTPVGDALRAYGQGAGYGPGVRTHMARCAHWHSWCAYQAGRAEALRQLAADLEDEARSIAGLGEVPWAAMLGLEVTSAAETALILRRAAQLALQRAEAPQNVPGRVLASRAPQPAGPAGDHHDSTEEEQR